MNCVKIFHAATAAIAQRAQRILLF